MYRPRAFAVDDVAKLHGVIGERSFATLAAVEAGSVQLAYTPIVLDREEGALGAARFHLAAANPLARVADGTPFLLSFLCADAYVSPDWYASAGMVPTWNYIAVEARGRAVRLQADALRQLLVDLAGEHEKKLAPKPPWTIEKVPPLKLETLMAGIVGFAVRFDALEGKLKLSQNLKAEDFDGVVRALDAQHSPVAQAMKREKS